MTTRIYMQILSRARSWLLIHELLMWIFMDRMSARIETFNKLKGLNIPRFGIHQIVWETCARSTWAQRRGLLRTCSYCRKVLQHRFGIHYELAHLTGSLMHAGAAVSSPRLCMGPPSPLLTSEAANIWKLCPCSVQRIYRKSWALPNRMSTMRWSDGTRCVLKQWSKNNLGSVWGRNLLNLRNLYLVHKHSSMMEWAWCRMPARVWEC